MFLFCISKKGAEAYIGPSGIAFCRILITPVFVIYLLVCKGIEFENKITDNSQLLDKFISPLMIGYWLISFISMYFTNSET